MILNHGISLFSRQGGGLQSGDLFGIEPGCLGQLHQAFFKRKVMESGDAGSIHWANFIAACWQKLSNLAKSDKSSRITAEVYMLLTREELQDRLFALHRASLELVKNISLETLLERIAALACEQAGARYGALGVLDEEGKLKRFITVGMSTEQMKQIPHPPHGLGLIGALMRGDSGNIRIPEIENDPRSVGFPAGHAEMHALLGVPIRIGELQLGQIYLTEKIGELEFSADEKIIEMLANYAVWRSRMPASMSSCRSLRRPHPAQRTAGLISKPATPGLARLDGS
jgi:transcriptional regulator with GAF, ATPase, and Fis domain